jgi:predicted GNAT family N-acyltransferase
VIQIKSWRDAEQEAFSIRKRVFIQEQGVPEEMELDEHDLTAQHALAYMGSQCIGTARLVSLPGNIGRIGRMAVLPNYRRRGIGRQLLSTLLELSKSHGITQLELHSQLSAIPFYEQSGFTGHGDIYDEAGIAHRDMILFI